MNNRRSIAALGVIAALNLATVARAQDADWNWVVAPYLWAASVSTDLRADQPPVDSQVEFPGILSKLDFGLQLHVEGQGERLGAFSDLTYLAFSDHHESTLFSSEGSLTATIFELAGVWSPGDHSYEGFEGFAGLRYLASKVDVTFDPVGPLLPNARRTVDKSYTDFMIGGRYTAKLSDRWALLVRGDGSFGGTDGTYNVSALFQYHMKKGAWVFGYRYMDAKLSGDDGSVHLTMNGPVVSYAFGFR
jgi:hypothetical protein